MKEKQKKQSIFRLIMQCISFAFQNGYINGWKKGSIYTGLNKQHCVPGLNCYSCPGAVGSCPIGSLQAVLDSGKYHFSLYVIGFIGLVGVFCGRFVCGWICPFGLIQDLVHKIPCKKKKNLPGHSKLRYLRYLVLIVFVIILPMVMLNQAGVGQPWFCEYICPSGTLIGGIPLVIANEGLRASIGFRFFWKVGLLILFLVGAIIYYRPFCKYICPLGALYGLLNPVSLYKLKIDEDACISCGACQRACGMDIKVWETPNSTDCIRCGQCKAACPKGAITSTFSSAINKADKKVEITESGKDIQTSTPKKGPLMFLSVFTLIAALFCLYEDFPYFVQACTSATYGTVQQIIQNTSSIFASIIPVIMLGFFSVFLLKILSKNESIASLKTWPKRILKLTGVCILVNYFLLFLAVSHNAESLATLPQQITAPIPLLLLGIQGYTTSLVLCLIFLMVFRDKKTKK